VEQPSRARCLLASRVVSAPSPSASPAAPGPDGPPIELGWITVGELPPRQAQAVRDARKAVGAKLAAWFPQFDWRMPEVSRNAGLRALVDEPAGRLIEGVQQRDARSWDFAIVVTPNDLRSYYKTHALAVPSRALAVAVLSLARLDAADADGAASAASAADGGDTDAADPQDPLARRVAALTLHLFGDLNGLWHRDQAGAVMQPPSSVGDLDVERTLAPDERETLAEELAEVADLRLEETEAPSSVAAFYLRAAWERAREIASAVVQAHPWAFPLRFSRLMAAALSALFVLLITAEVWDLGTSQRPATLVVLSLGVLAATTAFILSRQQLILRRAGARPTEQIVVAHVSATLIVVLGMATTYATLFALTLALGAALFDPELVARWAPSVEAPAGMGPQLRMAGLVASLGLLIGSLGASFEANRYFRHVIHADEET